MKRVPVPAIVMALLFTGCELFTGSIFPDFLPGVEARVRLTDSAPEYRALNYAAEDYSIRPRLLRNGAGEEYLFAFFEPRAPGVQPAMAVFSSDLQAAATYRLGDFGALAPTADFLEVDHDGRFALGLGNPTANIYSISDVRNKSMFGFGAPVSIWRRSGYSAGVFTQTFGPAWESAGALALDLNGYSAWGAAPTNVGGWPVDGMFNYQVYDVILNPAVPGEEVVLLLLRSDNRFVLLFLPGVGVQTATLNNPLASFYRTLVVADISNSDRRGYSLTSDGVAWRDEKNQEDVLLKFDGSRRSRRSDNRDIRFVYYEPSGAFGYYLMKREPEIFKVRSWWR